MRNYCAKNFPPREVHPCVSFAADGTFNVGGDGKVTVG